MVIFHVLVVVTGSFSIDSLEIVSGMRGNSFVVGSGSLVEQVEHEEHSTQEQSLPHESELESVIDVVPVFVVISGCFSVSGCSKGEGISCSVCSVSNRSEGDGNN